MNFSDYLNPAMLVVVAALVGLGMFLKKTPKMPDWLIPYILLAVGVGFGVVIVKPLVDGILQGILATSVTVFGHQLVKQAVERK